jgi:sugar-specific transcriptional regulator TrmB
MNQDQLFQTIRQLGFSDYEARCYLALFNKESLAVSEVAKISGVPRPNTYDALGKLMANGFIVSVPGKTKRYSVSDPNLLKEKSFLPMINSIEFELESLDRKRKEKTGTKAALEKNMDSVLKQLDVLYKDNRTNNNPLEFIEVMKDSRQIDNRFAQLLKESKVEVLSLTKQRFTGISRKVSKTVEYQVKFGTEIIRKGLSVKCIYELTPDKKHNEVMCKNIIDKFAAAGEQVRVMKDLPMRMAIFDEKIAMFTLVDPSGKCISSSFTTQVVRHPIMAKSLKIMFEALWDKAEDYYEYKKRIKAER